MIVVFDRRKVITYSRGERLKSQEVSSESQSSFDISTHCWARLPTAVLSSFISAFGMDATHPGGTFKVGFVTLINSLTIDEFKKANRDKELPSAVGYSARPAILGMNPGP